MKSLITQQAQALAKSWWQQAALVLLALMIVWQTISWGMTWWDLRKIDSLISETRSPQAKSEAAPTGGESGQKSEPQGSVALGPGGGPGMPPQPGQPGGSESPNQGDTKQPAKNIFRREQIPYQLSGIFMDTAVIDGQYVKIGERVGKAVVKEIAINTVKIQEDGKDQPREIQLFQGGGGGEGGGRENGENRGERSAQGSTRQGRPGGRPMTPQMAPGQSGQRPTNVAVPVMTGGPGGPGGGPRSISPEERERRIRERQARRTAGQ